jgi:hypothetical protein
LEIQVDLEGFAGLEFDTLWPRFAQFGEARAYCGTDYIVVISKAFTPDEDLALRWVIEQDSCVLHTLTHLADGRDIMLFERLYHTQTREEAVGEHRKHLRGVLANIKIPTQR